MVFNKNNQGYTLVELIVSVSIIALIASISLVNYHYAGRASELRLSSRQVATHIREVQSRAMSSLGSNCADSKSCAWGVYFTIDTTAGNNTRYFYFEDLDDDKYYDPGEQRSLVHELPKNIIIKNLEFSANQTEAHISFAPPDPLVSLCYGNDAGSGGCESSVLVVLSNGTNTNKILINGFGLIDVE